MSTQTNPATNPEARHEGHADCGHASGSARRWVFAGFVAVAAFFLLSEHRAHFFGALPYLLVLACPLMHLFMHHGHGAHDRKENDK